MQNPAILLSTDKNIVSKRHFVKQLIARCLLLLVALSPSFAQATSVKEVAEGKTSNYLFNGSYSQDLSGATFFDGKVFLVYDGGHNSEYPEIRHTSLDKIENEASLLKRKVTQHDIEGATELNGTVFITSSLSRATEGSAGYRILSSFKLDPQGQVVDERNMYARQMIMSALESEFGDQQWLHRVRVSIGKRGGLNVEGLSRSPSSNTSLVFGLRSPLYSEQFGDPALKPTLSLRTGNAILLEISDPFASDYQFKASTIDLNGQGIRGLEYIPKMKGYIIISGNADVGDNYGLWFYNPVSQEVKALSEASPRFAQLCRPEAVLNIPQQSHFIILSEESGKACEDASITFIKYGF